MRLQKHSDSKVLAAAFMLGLFVLLLPAMSRLAQGHPLLYGTEAYLNARISQQALSPPANDFFVYGTRPFAVNPYHVTVAGLSKLIGIQPALVLIPALLGLGVILLFYSILKKLGLLWEERGWAVMMLILSPAFIYTFTSATAACMSVFLCVLGFRLLMSRNLLACLSAIGALALAVPFGLPHAVIAVFLLLMMLSGSIKPLPRAAAILLLLAAVMLVTGAPSNRLPVSDLLATTLSDFGSLNGFGAFSWILFIIGFFTLWRKKEMFMFEYAALLALALLYFFFGSAVNPYSMFFVSIFSGITITSMLRRRWRVQLIKNLTVMITICGLLFSTAAYLNRLMVLEPSNEAMESLKWLQDQAPGNVLSESSRGFWIEYGASMPVLQDGLSGRDFVQKDMIVMFSSRNLERTKLLMDTYSVRYIWIDSRMRAGQVWSKPDEGLLFLFRSNETFRKVYANPEVQIWEYLR